MPRSTRAARRSPGQLRRLQRTFADLLFDAHGDRDFARAPAAFAAGRGVAVASREPLLRQQGRLLLYRALTQTAYRRTLDSAFPVLCAFLSGEDAWRICVRDFMHARTVRGHCYRDVSRHFVLWLAESGWGSDHWPFIGELAHYELLELDLERALDTEPAAGLLAEPAPELVVRFDPTTRNLTYRFAVQRTTPEQAVPAAETTHLLCHRDREGAFAAHDLDGRTSELLAALLAGTTIGAATGDDLDEAAVLERLRELRAAGAIHGFERGLPKARAAP